MFLKIRAGDSGDRSPWGDFWFGPTPYRSGGVVSGDQALRLTVIYRCVRLLSDAMAQLPFMLYQPQDDGGRKRITDHWLYRLFAIRPNAWQDPFQFRQMLDAHMELRGNAYARIVANSRGEVTDLIPMHPDRIAIEMLSNDDWRYRYTNRDGSYKYLPRSQVFAPKYFTLDGIVGMNPIEAAREAIATGLEAQNYGLRFFQNDGRPGGWITHPSQFKDDEQRRQWRERWQESQSGANRGKTAVLEFGMTYHPIDITNADAQFIESKKYTVTDLARLYGVPPHKVGDLDKATFSNIEQQSLDFVNDAIAPRAACWAAAIAYSFIQDDENLAVDLPTAVLQRADSTARANVKQKLVLSGVMTRNEARLDEGLNPLPGLDEPLRPLNTAPENEADEEETEANGADQQPKPRGPGDAQRMMDSNARMSAMANAVAERIARKESELVTKAMKASDPWAALHAAYEKHAEFVAQALAIPTAEAHRYCESQFALLRVAREQLNGEFAELAKLRLVRLASEEAYS